MRPFENTVYFSPHRFNAECATCASTKTACPLLWPPRNLATPQSRRHNERTKPLVNIFYPCLNATNVTPKCGNTIIALSNQFVQIDSQVSKMTADMRSADKPSIYLKHMKSSRRMGLVSLLK